MDKIIIVFVAAFFLYLSLAPESRMTRIYPLQVITALGFAVYAVIKVME